MSGNVHANYRGDVDGLRAVAVVAVILNHFYAGFMPSGFLGVDVFFVISGYVITQSLVSMKSGGWVEYLADFYAKRIRRLLPALIFCVAVTVLLFMFLTLDPQREIFVTGGLSLLGLSNLYLLKIASNYFSIDAHLNPFTHTWSLGVEEQFYFIYPALIAFCGLTLVKADRAWSRTFKVLAGFSLISFVLYCFLFFSRPVFAFYSMPARFWEFCFGAFVFFFISKQQSIGLSEQWQNTLLSLFFVGLLGLFFVPVEYQLYTTISAVLLSAGLIALSSSGKFVFRMLCSKPLLYLGGLSYSLYLWHWSILVLGRYTLGGSWLASLILLLIVIIFALFSYYFIERPLRYSALLAGRIRPLLLVVFLVLPGAYFIVREAPEMRVDGLNLTSLMGVEAVPSWAGTIPCHGDNQAGNDEAFLSACLKPERTVERPHVFFLLGDSHAAQLTFMLNKAVEQMPYSVRFAHNASDDDFPRSFLSGQASAPTLDYVVKVLRPGDVVAIAMHRGRLNHDRDRHIDLSESVELDERAKFFEEHTALYIKEILAKGGRVLLIRDTPLMSVVAKSEACKLQIHFLGESICRVSKEQDLHTRRRLDLVYDRLLSGSVNVYDWDPFDLIYPAKGYVDVVDESGRYVMMDSHHITRYQSEKMAAGFSAFIRSQMLK